ncbi:MAG: Txe/YoeB family addiction module toxin [Paludibacter sp.]|nr:Txe/YoeB family addiction module toxin [Paludibacter sp.]
MEIELTDDAKKDLYWHKKTGNKGINKKIEQLFFALLENPYDGIGQPEELKHDLQGNWSRRINLEHRLIYTVDEDNQIIYIISMWGHYK